ncbi:flagellar biosynthesis protein FlhB [Hyphococcus sp.]|jgi:flagellar biosynthetic protein FlhB|uniref:flagellar biosynthesis protein FlhB n=1 Tax=Hyphococcus sp. TaxID=2038636 RepID=UPI003D0DC930
MSDETDQSQKTEDPSEKKLRDARKKGDTPTSREVATAASIACAAGLMAFGAPGVANEFRIALGSLISNVHDIRIASAYQNLGALWTRLFTILFVALCPIFAGFAAAGFLSAFAQNAVVFATERIKPQANRISPAKGFKRMFSQSSLVELAKSMAKVTVVTTVVVMFTASEISDLSSAAAYDIASMPGRIQRIVVRLLSVVFITTIAIAVLDVLWRRFEWRRNLKMTKQEVKDEHKALEGDPQIKARIAEMRRSRKRRARLQAVPTATVVITNPTHYAVALRYAPEESDAPICVAKGRNKIALKIREIAKRHNVPVVENKPLARGLHAALQEDQPIPEEYYKAVAEIINFVYRSGARSMTL